MATEKLELKDIAPYLPYKLGLLVDAEFKGVFAGINTRPKESYAPVMIISDRANIIGRDYHNVRPILRPLSDLTKEIELNRETFIPIERLKIPLGLAVYLNASNIKNMPYRPIEKLLEWHFDIFGLIEKGLAIDKNTLNDK